MQLSKPIPKAFQPFDLLIEPTTPLVREASPVGLGRRTTPRQGPQGFGDLLQRQPDALRRADECQAAQHRPLVAALVPRCAARGDQPEVLVVPQG